MSLMMRNILILLVLCVYFHQCAFARFYYDNFRERKNLRFRGARPGPDGCVSLSSRREETPLYNTAYYEKRMRLRKGDPKGFVTSFKFKLFREEAFLTNVKDADGLTLLPGEGISFFVSSSVSGRPKAHREWTMGYDNMGQGFAVELDTNSNTQTQDPAEPHVSVHWTGSAAEMHVRAQEQKFATWPTTSRPRLTAVHDDYSAWAPLELQPRILSASAFAEANVASLTREERRNKRSRAVEALSARASTLGITDSITVSVNYHSGLVSVFVGDPIVPKIQVMIPPLHGDFLIGFASVSSARTADHYRICDWQFERTLAPHPSLLAYAQSSSIVLPPALHTAAARYTQATREPCDPGFAGSDCVVDTRGAAKECILATASGCRACVGHRRDCRWCAATNRCVPGALVGSAEALSVAAHQSLVRENHAHMLDARLRDTLLSKHARPDAHHASDASKDPYLSDPAFAETNSGKGVSGRPLSPLERAAGIDIELYSVCPDAGTVLSHEEECPIEQTRRSATANMLTLVAAAMLVGYVARTYLDKHRLQQTLVYAGVCIVHSASVGGVTSVSLAYLINTALFEITLNRAVAVLFTLMFTCVGAYVLHCAHAKAKAMQATGPLVAPQPLRTVSNGIVTGGSAVSASSSSASASEGEHDVYDLDIDLHADTDVEGHTAAPHLAVASTSSSASGQSHELAASNDAFLLGLAQSTNTQPSGRRDVWLLRVGGCVCIIAALICARVQDEWLTTVHPALKVLIYMVLASTVSYTTLFVAFEAGHTVTRIATRITHWAKDKPDTLRIRYDKGPEQQPLPYSLSSLELLLISCAATSAGTFFGVTFGSLDVADHSRLHVDLALQKDNLFIYPVSLLTGIVTGGISEYWARIGNKQRKLTGFMGDGL